MKKNSKGASKKYRNDIYNRLIKYFKKHVNEGAYFADLAEYCHINEYNYPLLEDVVNRLISENHIALTKENTYIRHSKTNLLVGVLRLKDQGFGFVKVDDSEEEIFVKNTDVNKAFHNDRVVVEVLAVKKGDLREGRVISVEERAQNTFPGTFRSTSFYNFVKPLDRKYSREFLIPPGEEANAKDGDIVVVEMANWDERDANPTGKVVKILGDIENWEVEMQALLASYGVSDAFSDDVKAESDAKKLEITPELINERLDLRELELFTIDPVDAKDFDDAVSLDHLDNGNWYLGVHIADVSHFVEEGSELDNEAMARGCSVYLVDRVIPMLPEYLSNGLCSLKPNEDRLAYSCFMEIEPGSGDMVSYEIKPSVINSKRRFAYEEVQEILDDESSADAFAPKLQAMWQLAAFLMGKRIEAGAMDFDTPEVGFKLDDEGFPIDIFPKPRLNAMRLIEEFMLMANKTVAIHIERLADERRRLPFVYRIHEKPKIEKLERFVAFMNILGYKISVDKLSSVKNFQEILNAAHGTQEMNLVEEVALRSMMKAIYSTANKGHYGLGFSHYTHFTSPIRRYPDLWVHRLLKEYDQLVAQKRLHFLKQHLKKVCDQSSAQEVNAQQAERESVKIKQIEYIGQYIDEEFDGTISGVTEFGLFVSIDNILIEGLVHIRDMEDDYYIYDENALTLTGKNKRNRFRLGDKIRIRVVSVNKVSRNIDFVIVAGGTVVKKEFDETSPRGKGERGKRERRPSARPKKTDGKKKSSRSKRTRKNDR
jgi:ribonuclease R